MSFINNYVNKLIRLKDLLLFEHVAEGSDFLDGIKQKDKDSGAIQEVYFDDNKRQVCKITYSKDGIFYETSSSNSKISLL